MQARRRQHVVVFLLSAVLALLLSVLVLGVIQFGNTNDALKREIAQRCIDAKANRDGIRATIAGSLENLGYQLDETGELVPTKQGPLAYYRERPGERDRVLNQVLTALRETFPPIDCNTTKEDT